MITNPARASANLYARVALAISLAFASAGTAHADLPRIQLYAASPPGGQRGTTFDLSLTYGADLDDANRIIFTHPGITAVQKSAVPPYRAAPQPVAGAFTVTIAPDTPVGHYEMRVVGKYGVSNPRIFAVGDIPEVMEKGPNSSRETASPVPLNSVVNGVTDTASNDWYKFTAKAGQRIFLDCWGERIDSAADPALAIFAADGNELANNRDTHGRDPFLDVSIPVDGDYFFIVRDVLYRGGASWFYRCSLTTTPYIDFVFPPVAVRGAKNRMALYGRNLPNGTPANLKSRGGELSRLDIEIDAPETAPETPLLLSGESSVVDGFLYRLVSESGSSNPLFIGLVDTPPVAEIEPNDEPTECQKIQTPCVIAGQFLTRRDRDRFQFEAKKGDALWITLASRRFGARTDPYFLVQRVSVDAKGVETVSDIEQADDDPVSPLGASLNAASRDAKYRFVAPEDGVYRILVQNQSTATDPSACYALSLVPPRPDFRLFAAPRYLTATPNATNLPVPFLRRGATELIEVGVLREGDFAGDVNVAIENLPPGVTSPGVTIHAAESMGLLPLTCAEDAPAFVGAVRVVGKAKIGETETTHPARIGAILWSDPFGQGRHPTRVTTDLMLAISAGEVSPVSLAMGDGKPLDMSRGGKIEIPVKLTRRGDNPQPVTISGVGFPGNLEAPPITLDAKTNEGKFIINVKKEAATGPFSVAFLGATTVTYARNPESVAAAKAAKDEIETSAAGLAAQAAQSEEEKKKSDANLAAVNTAGQNAAAAQKTATEAEAKANQEANAAATKATEAKAAAEKEPANAALAEANTLAAKESTDATARVVAAREAKAAADKAVIDTQAAAKAATDTQSAAQAKLTEAQAKAKAATDAKTAAEKALADATAAAAPKPLPLIEPSSLVHLQIRATPVETAPFAVTVQQGATAEIPLAVQRLYGFNGAVAFAAPAQLPKGIVIEPAPAAEAQPAGKLVVKCAADARVGAHKIELSSKLTFNGQELPSAHPVTITIESAAK